MHPLQFGLEVRHHIDITISAVVVIVGVVIFVVVNVIL